MGRAATAGTQAAAASFSVQAGGMLAAEAAPALAPVVVAEAGGALGMAVGTIGQTVMSVGNSGSGAAGAAPKGSGTVWDSIKPTQPVYEGTAIPRSFELETANGTVWVHGNATEHLAEYATANLNRGVTPGLVNAGTQCS